jgi:hypothetical protein
MPDKTITTKIKVPSAVYELVAELIRMRDAVRVLSGFASDDPKVKEAMRLLCEREDELMGKMHG